MFLVLLGQNRRGESEAQNIAPESEQNRAVTCRTTDFQNAESGNQPVRQMLKNDALPV